MYEEKAHPVGADKDHKWSCLTVVDGRKTSMKTKLGISLGMVAGIATYEAIKHGAEQIDWTRVVVVPLIAFGLLLLLPSRWFEKKKAAS